MKTRKNYYSILFLLVSLIVTANLNTPDSGAIWIFQHQMDSYYMTW